MTKTYSEFYNIVHNLLRIYHGSLLVQPFSISQETKQRFLKTINTTVFVNLQKSPWSSCSMRYNIKLDLELFSSVFYGSKLHTQLWSSLTWLDMGSCSNCKHVDIFIPLIVSDLLSNLQTSFFGLFWQEKQTHKHTQCITMCVPYDIWPCLGPKRWYQGKTSE